MNFLKKTVRFFGKLPVYFYKGIISPLLPHACRFYPTCSNYFIDAVNQFGVFKGSKIGIARICRCNPMNKESGYDPVPINIKGETKWLL